jgi:hypothetical protein
MTDAVNMLHEEEQRTIDNQSFQSILDLGLITRFSYALNGEYLTGISVSNLSVTESCGFGKSPFGMSSTFVPERLIGKSRSIPLALVRNNVQRIVIMILSWMSPNLSRGGVESRWHFFD